MLSLTVHDTALGFTTNALTNAMTASALLLNHWCNTSATLVHRVAHLSPRHGGTHKSNIPRPPALNRTIDREREGRKDQGGHAMREKKRARRMSGKNRGMERRGIVRDGGERSEENKERG